MKRKFSDASFGSMSHHQGTKGSWKDKNRKSLGKSPHQNRDKTASPYIVDNKLIPRVRKVSGDDGILCTFICVGCLIVDIGSFVEIRIEHCFITVGQCLIDVKLFAN